MLQMLQWLIKHNLYAKGEKYAFYKTSVAFLGYVISVRRRNNGPGQDGGCAAVIPANYSEGGAVIRRVHKILPAFHS